MAKNYFLPMFSVILFLLLLQVNCENLLTPALYVFGDSLSDTGNNNFLKTNAKVNFKPYGVDFPSGAPTGRFSNGMNFIDHVAQFLELPFVPAYLGLTKYNKTHITTGINYASGAAGILPETGRATGDILTLDEQISCFKSTVKNDLPKNFKTKAGLLSHLSKSIFSVNIGGNDYINNYLKPAEYNSSRIYTPRKFAYHLVHHLQKHITRLYHLGARKFVMFNVGRLGCVPGVLETLNHLPTTICAEDINQVVLLYNTKLLSMIKTLESTLIGTTFVTGDMYSMGSSSAAAGFNVRYTPCCKSRDAVTGLCRQSSSPCLERSLSVFWDAYHPTEVVNFAQATECFSGNTMCKPINILQLSLTNNIKGIESEIYLLNPAVTKNLMKSKKQTAISGQKNKRDLYTLLNY